MLNLVVCIKQVPIVSELPRDAKTGSLRRGLAEAMMNPACKHALEAALQLKQEHNCQITVISMGPHKAEEILHEAVAMGADRGILLCDPQMAGADTLVTSHTLAQAIKKEIPAFDLVLCGCFSSDSETAQVGPQLAEELAVPSSGYVEKMEIKGRIMTMQRVADNFIETLAFDLPGLVTVSTREYAPRYVSLKGLEDAFDAPDICILKADDIGLAHNEIGIQASPTKILNVYSADCQKKNLVLKGPAKKIINTLFATFSDRLSGAIGKDLKMHDHHGEKHDS